MADLIDRQAAIDAVNEYFARIGKSKRRGLTKGEKAISLDTVGAIKTLPTAEPERRRGHWIEIQAPDSDGNGLYECSICHRGEVHVPIVEVPYCWHCGAQMTEGEE